MVYGMSDVVFPRLDLRRGGMGLAAGNAGAVCRNTVAGEAGAEMSVD
jgi:hypothetical protein